MGLFIARKKAEPKERPAAYMAHRRPGRIMKKLLPILMF